MNKPVSALSLADALDVATDAFHAGTEDAPEAAHKAALLSAKAKLVAGEFAIRGGSQLFDVGGASATKKVTNLDRHNARTFAMRELCPHIIRPPSRPDRSGNMKSAARRRQTKGSSDKAATQLS